MGLGQLSRYLYGSWKKMSRGPWGQILSLKPLGRARSEVTALLPVYGPRTNDTEEACAPLDARPSHRRKDPVLLSFHLHLPLNWNFFILFQLFIWFLRDLTRQAVVSVKLLWQWGSHQTLFFFFFGRWEFQVWNISGLASQWLHVSLFCEVSSQSQETFNLQTNPARWFVLLRRKLWIREGRGFVPGSTLSANIWTEKQTNLIWPPALLPIPELGTQGYSRLAIVPHPPNPNGGSEMC